MSMETKTSILQLFLHYLLDWIVTGWSPRAKWLQKQWLQVLSPCSAHFAYQILFFFARLLALLTKFSSASLGACLQAIFWLSFKFFYKVTIHLTQSRDPSTCSTLLTCAGRESSAQMLCLLMECLFFCRCKNIHWLQGTAVIVRNWNGLCRTQAGQWIRV